MATIIKILPPSEIKAFNSPPIFNAHERKQFFRPPKYIMDIITTFRTPTNKVGFILQFGYFKTTNKFFTAKEFHRIFLQNLLNLINMSNRP